MLDLPSQTRRFKPRKSCSGFLGRCDNGHCRRQVGAVAVGVRFSRGHRSFLAVPYSGPLAGPVYVERPVDNSKLSAPKADEAELINILLEAEPLRQQCGRPYSTSWLKCRASRAKGTRPIPWAAMAMRSCL